MHISENDYEILKSIIKEENKGIYKAKGTDIHEIMSYTNLSYNKIYQVMNKFVENGICEYGLMRGKRKTFILTDKGFDLLENISGEDN